MKTNVIRCLGIYDHTAFQVIITVFIFIFIVMSEEELDRIVGEFDDVCGKRIVKVNVRKKYNV